MISTKYHNQYFGSGIFDYDYTPIADAIIKKYTPSSIIEFGCGNGELSKALAKKKINITALDAYSDPDFASYNNIHFYKMDLNDPHTVKSFFQSLNQKFDVAICLEVAEHLSPEVSSALIEVLTSVAGTVVFSAAVPQQNGEGHINCRNRTFWHALFGKNNFQLRDTIRSEIRENPLVGKWYALNIVDYVKSDQVPSVEEFQKLVYNLLEAESEASSNFYFANRRAEYKDQILSFRIVNAAFKFRNFIKKSIGMQTVSKDIHST